MKTANLINYFDVWGNKTDGWEVNNLCSEGEIELPENYTNKDVLKSLKFAGFLRAKVQIRQLVFEDLFPYIEISQAKDMRPICRLELNEDEF